MKKTKLIGGNLLSRIMLTIIANLETLVQYFPRGMNPSLHPFVFATSVHFKKLK